MFLLLWNLKGLYSSRQQKETMDLIKEKKIDIAGIIETKMWKEKREELRKKWVEEWKL